MLLKVKELAEKFNDESKVANELKRVQSIKCRLKKQQERKDYEESMQKTLEYEEALKQVRQMLNPPKKTVTTYTVEDIKLLNFDETIKAIKSIQSKKCLSQFNPDKTEYNKACQIEKMLLEHKSTTAPLNENVVAKTEISNLISNIEDLKKVDKNWLLEQLNKLK